MERVKILSVVGATAKNGKTYYKIQLEDGRKINDFNEKFLQLAGKEANVEITKEGDYLKIKLVEEEKKTDPKVGDMQYIKLEIAKAVGSHVMSVPGNSFEDTIAMCDCIYKWVIS
jgi:hypothetical protein